MYDIVYTCHMYVYVRIADGVYTEGRLRTIIIIMTMALLFRGRQASGEQCRQTLEDVAVEDTDTAPH